MNEASKNVFTAWIPLCKTLDNANLSIGSKVGQWLPRDESANGGSKTAWGNFRSDGCVHDLDYGNGFKYLKTRHTSYTSIKL